MPFRKIFLLSILLLQISTSALCQKIFREGYIVKNNGDFLNGLIEFKPGQNVPAVCIFKRFEIAVEMEYKPAEIKDFGYVNGNRYASKNISGKNYFFEVLVSGNITLYIKDSKYYIEKSQSGLVEVNDGSINYTSEGKEQRFDSLTSFLKFLTQDKSVSIKDKIDPKKDLIPIITEYNKAYGGSFTVYNREFSDKQFINQSFREGTGRNRFGFTGGMNIYIFKLFPTTDYYLPSPVPESSAVFGLTYERVISRKNDKLAIRADLLFLKQTFYSYSEFTYSVYTYRDDAFFNFTGIRLPLMAQYSFLSGRFSPFMNAGVSYTVFIETGYLHIRETENSYHEVLTTEDSRIPFYPGELSGFCSAGMKLRTIKNISLRIEGRIEIGQGLFNEVLDINKYKQMSIQPTFLLGITF